jgi:hypothetical protein
MTHMELEAGLDQLVRPLLAVWNAIGHDVEDSIQAVGDELSNEGAIELCLDADHLRYTGGDAQADALLHQLVRQHGLDQVIKGLARRVTLA